MVEIPPAHAAYDTRQQRLGDLLIEQKLDALSLIPGPSLYYLTGLQFHLMERPVVAIFRPEGEATIVLGELETPKLEDLPFEIQAFPYSDNPAAWAEAFQQAARHAKLDGARVGLDPARMRILEYRLLEAAAPKAKWDTADELLADLRMIKDQGEVLAMRRAVKIAQDALLATLSAIQPGMTERQVANLLVIHLLQQGSQPGLPFDPIVASGPNSANPHAQPTDRPLTPGDLVVIDWGANVEGYYSDLTRTFFVGEIAPELNHIAEVVMQANAAGITAAHPGIPAGEVDRAARSVIEQAGYGEYFTHRTGHGLGLDAHEPPYLFAENPNPLENGMTFTVEPGIYLPGRGGVRVEDNLLITPKGCESLSDLPRELQRIA